MGLNLIPLAVSLVPFTAIHVSYLLAASFDHVPWCLPYIDSCTSISAVGRENPERILFRAMMIPSAALMLVFWSLVHEWLKTLGSRPAIVGRVMLVCGLIAGLGLIAYASALGEFGGGYSLQRRIGVRFFFGFTVLAELLMAIQVERTARSRACFKLMWTARALLAISSTTILAGLASLYLWAYFEEFDSIEHAFAWWVTLLVLLPPLAVFFLWKESGFQARFDFTAR